MSNRGKVGYDRNQKCIVGATFGGIIEPTEPISPPEVQTDLNAVFFTTKIEQLSSEIDEYHQKHRETQNKLKKQYEDNLTLSKELSKYLDMLSSLQKTHEEHKAKTEEELKRYRELVETLEQKRVREDEEEKDRKVKEDIEKLEKKIEEMSQEETVTKAVKAEKIVKKAPKETLGKTTTKPTVKIAFGKKI